MKLLTLAKNLLRKLPDEGRIAVLARSLPRKMPAGISGSRTVLVQCVADPYYLSIFSAVIHQLSKDSPTNVDLVVTRSIETSFGNAPSAYLKRSFGYAGLLSRRWINAYSSVGSKVGYRSVGWGSPLIDLRALMRTFSIRRRRHTVRDLERTRIDGILCGDLIIDTYLRFKPAAEIQLDDLFLTYVIWQAARDVGRARHYFENHKPRLYLTSFATYVQHGVAARVALDSGLKVVAFGNHQQLGKTLTKDDFYQTKNPVNYKLDFANRPDKDEILVRARNQLESRLGGGVDVATAYMAKSAYSEDSLACPDVTNAVIVFLHDFFDSPHIYPDLVFPEFWSWICFTIDSLQADGTPFFLKPHPNQVGASAEVIQRLIQKYPGVRLIPASISNSQLAKGGMRCALTVYGTVVHEMAYLGVPSIAAARHPHVAFDFCKTARTETEYREMLRSILSLKLDDPAEAREQVLQFYSMHNLDEGDEAIEAREALVQLWKCCTEVEASADNIISALKRLSSTEGFRQFVRTLV